MPPKKAKREADVESDLSPSILTTAVSMPRHPEPRTTALKDMLRDIVVDPLLKLSTPTVAARPVVLPTATPYDFASLTAPVKKLPEFQSVKEVLQERSERFAIIFKHMSACHDKIDLLQAEVDARIAAHKQAPPAATRKAATRAASALDDIDDDEDAPAAPADGNADKRPDATPQTAEEIREEMARVKAARGTAGNSAGGDESDDALVGVLVEAVANFMELKSVARALMNETAQFLLNTVVIKASPTPASDFGAIQDGPHGAGVSVPGLPSDLPKIPGGLSAGAARSVFGFTPDIDAASRVPEPPAEGESLKVFSYGGAEATAEAAGDKKGAKAAKGAKASKKATTDAADGQHFVICEVEAYVECKDKRLQFDTFAHSDTAQWSAGNFYFHRKGGSFKAGSFKGMDITFGDPDTAAVAFLVRAVRPVVPAVETWLTTFPSNNEDHRKIQVASQVAWTPTADVVPGPSVTVDALLAAAGAKNIQALVAHGPSSECLPVNFAAKSAAGRAAANDDDVEVVPVTASPLQLVFASSGGTARRKLPAMFGEGSTPEFDNDAQPGPFKNVHYTKSQFPAGAGGSATAEFSTKPYALMVFQTFDGATLTRGEDPWKSAQRRVSDLPILRGPRVGLVPRQHSQLRDVAKFYRYISAHAATKVKNRGSILSAVAAACIESAVVTAQNVTGLDGDVTKGRLAGSCMNPGDSAVQAKADGTAGFKPFSTSVARTAGSWGLESIVRGLAASGLKITKPVTDYLAHQLLPDINAAGHGLPSVLSRKDGTDTRMHAMSVAVEHGVVVQLDSAWAPSADAPAEVQRAPVRLGFTGAQVKSVAFSPSFVDSLRRMFGSPAASVSAVCGEVAAAYTAVNAKARLQRPLRESAAVTRVLVHCDASPAPTGVAVVGGVAAVEEAVLAQDVTKSDVIAKITGAALARDCL